jgi:hypothetical protein
MAFLLLAAAASETDLAQASLGFGPLRHGSRGWRTDAFHIDCRAFVMSPGFTPFEVRAIRTIWCRRREVFRSSRKRVESNIPTSFLHSSAPDSTHASAMSGQRGNYVKNDRGKAGDCDR